MEWGVRSGGVVFIDRDKEVEVGFLKRFLKAIAIWILESHLGKKFRGCTKSREKPGEK